MYTLVRYRDLGLILAIKSIAARISQPLKQ